MCSKLLWPVTRRAVGVLTNSGRVVAWEAKESNSGAFREVQQLCDVRFIATSFVALLASGKVVVWLPAFFTCWCWFMIYIWRTLAVSLAGVCTRVIQWLSAIRNDGVKTLGLGWLTGNFFTLGGSCSAIPAAQGIGPPPGMDYRNPFKWHSSNPSLPKNHLTCLRALLLSESRFSQASPPCFSSCEVLPSTLYRDCPESLILLVSGAEVI